MEQIVIVGGGAGGLGLATYLGHKLGRKKQANIVLVDKNSSHLWKPLLHEVATGSLDDGTDALSYRAHAKNHGFEYQQGSLTGVNSADKTITLAAIYGSDNSLLVPERQIHYDKLVIAIGSRSNDFNTPGVKEHCIFLDSSEQAHLFHKKMMELFLKFANNQEKELHIAVVGGGATGIELSAELYNVVDALPSYGYGKINNASLKVTLLEAGGRLLPALPERVSASALSELRKLGVDVRLNTAVTEAQSDGLITKDGEKIQADLMVWAAGVKAPEMTQTFGFETNRINQIAVRDTLQTLTDDNVYVIGDCAFLLQADGKPVPPRAQSAHQMATACAKNILAQRQNKPLKPFVFDDKGSLVSFSRFGSVGSLMGNLTKGSMFIEGKIARIAYLSLYRMHQVALHGYIKTGLIMLVGRINRFLRPSMKLH